MRIWISTVFALACFCSYAQKTYLHCGTLIDGKSNEVQQQATVVVEGGKIIAVEKGFVTPDASSIVIDLKQKTVMPGFIDMHVHLEGETNKDQSLQRFTLNEADIAFRSAMFAKKTLMAGFTTVRDLGGTGVNIALRNAINQGTVVGPRIFTAGSRSQRPAATLIQRTATARTSWETRVRKKA
jgi:imidazolonepropionase-like amidohydrolase